MNKIALYCINFNDYDDLYQPMFVDKEVTYHVITDKVIKDPGIYKQIVIKKDPDDRVLQRILKIDSGIFADYDVEIYVDCNFQQIKSVMPLVELFLAEESQLLTMRHPHENCVYNEIKHCIALEKAPKEILEAQRDEYLTMSVPSTTGMGMFIVFFKSLELSLGLFVEGLNKFPVDHIPVGLHIALAHILVVEVVGVLPNINVQQRGSSYR